MAILLTTLAFLTLTTGNDMARPRMVFDGTKPISAELGHAAPLLYDIDGDGKRELLVGQFGGGKLRIYKNMGTETNPRFNGYTFFEAGGKVASVPYG
jgi:hypothetical protein